MKGIHNDQLQQVIKKAQQEGWVITRTRGSHLRFFPPRPGSAIVFFSGTPGDHRAVRNLATKLKREGLDLKKL